MQSKYLSGWFARRGIGLTYFLSVFVLTVSVVQAKMPYKEHWFRIEAGGAPLYEINIVQRVPDLDLALEVYRQGKDKTLEVIEIVDFSGPGKGNQETTWLWDPAPGIYCARVRSSADRLPAGAYRIEVWVPAGGENSSP